MLAHLCRRLARALAGPLTFAVLGGAVAVVVWTLGRPDDAGTPMQRHIRHCPTCADPRLPVGRCARVIELSRDLVRGANGYDDR